MELPGDLLEYLQIDVEKDEALDNIFQSLHVYLLRIKEFKSALDLTIPLAGAIDKYLRCLEYLGMDVDNTELRNLCDEFVSLVEKYNAYRNSTRKINFIRSVFRPSLDQEIKNNIANIDSKIDIVFQQLYTRIIEIFNTAKAPNRIDREEKISLNGFFNPETANKDKAKGLILAAIEAIKTDTTLTEKSKISIVEYLRNAIKEFDKPNSNWTLIFGRLKETIFVLGALGSLAGGITGYVALKDAKDKLEEASSVLEQTSVNINYNTMSQIFNVENGNLVIEATAPKLLIEKNETFTDELGKDDKE